MTDKKQASKAADGDRSVGESIIAGLEQAIAWTKGESQDAQVTKVHVPKRKTS